MARVLKGSHSFTCIPRVHPLTEWTIPAFAFPAEAGTHFLPPRRVGRLSWLWVAARLHTEINVRHRELNPGKVARFSTNRARRRLTSLIEAKALTIGHCYVSHSTSRTCWYRAATDDFDRQRAQSLSFKWTRIYSAGERAFYWPESRLWTRCPLTTEMYTDTRRFLLLNDNTPVCLVSCTVTSLLFFYNFHHWHALLKLRFCRAIANIIMNGVCLSTLSVMYCLVITLFKRQTYQLCDKQLNYCV